MSLAADIIPLFVVIPLAGAFLISLIGRRIRIVPVILGIISTLSLFCLSLASVSIAYTHSVIVYSVGIWRPPIGIAMVLDSFSAFMLVTVNLVAAAIAVYAVNYMEKFTAKWKFYTLFLLMLAGMNGVIVTGDIFNLFVFLEIASVASYALVAFGTERHELEAAFKYAVMSAVGSLFILISIVFLYSYTSTLNMADMSNVLANKGMSNIWPLVSVLLIMGFGLKAALVPFHAWLPDAHPSAPAPISAMLSAVLIKTLGIYTICRIFYNIFGFSSQLSNIFMFLGALSMIIGAFLAIGQWDLKRLLAYSSISQIGYIVLSLGIGTPLAITGGLFHLFNHSIFKSLLFLNSGAIEYSTGTRDLREMGGLFKKMPVTGSTNLVASMSISGIPPFSGFWSKLIIIIAMVESGHYIYALLAVIVSVVTLAYFMKVMKYAYYGSLKEQWSGIVEAPVFMKLSMIFLAVICVIGGIIAFPVLNNIFLGPASDVLAKGLNYAVVVLRSIR